MVVNTLTHGGIPQGDTLLTHGGIPRVVNLFLHTEVYPGS